MSTVVLCVAEELTDCPVSMRWTAPQRHRDVQIDGRDGLTWTLVTHV